MPILTATPAAIGDAAQHLAAGRLVAFPTETVYGLGGDAGSDSAVAAIFAAKGRPTFNPLIVHAPGALALEEAVVFDGRARRLAELFWPGPLTLVLPRHPRSRVSLLTSAGLDSIAVRVPSHPVALALLRAAGVLVAAPSANRSGRVSPTSAAHVAEGLADRVAMILDGGTCPVGVESTVLDLTGDRPTLLRPGGTTLESLEEAIGAIDIAGPIAPDTPRSPGQLSSHYAPALPVRLNASRPEEGEAFMGFGPVDGATLNLSPTGDLSEAAANLFAMMRRLDDSRYRAIAVAPIPNHGLGRAINDRLRRAAAPRPS
ncbi:MAG: threonylcarbamoyl-AMP synthase [Telmatospirillum sp.]|nr:threonylcarbamoyl-AMP synthase [Telmatospirillum sp.]